MPLGGGSGGGNQTSTTNTTSNPWSGIQPQLLQATGDLQNLYNNGGLNYQYFPGSTIGGQSQETQDALQMQISRARNGSPLNAANQGMLNDTISGKYLDPNSNPYLKGTYDQAAQGVQGTLNSSFGQGGRYGSGLNQQTLGNSLGNLANNIYGGNYQQERSRQLAASALAPSAANQDYYDIGQLSSAGGAIDQRNQDFLNEDINRYNFNQQSPANNISNYIGLLNGAGGQYGSRSGTTSQPYYGGGGGANTLGLLGALGSGGFGSLGTSVAQGFGPAAASSYLGGSGLLGSLGSLASLFAVSDINLKENIKHTGYEKGIPIYTFSYKDDPHHIKYRGVMAQDIQETHPDAVHEVGGYLAVDYKKLGIEFARIH